MQIQSLYQKAIKFAAAKHAAQNQTIPDTTLRSLSEAQERAVNALHLAGFSSFSPVSVSTAADEHGGVS